ncbi:hypothetical protein Tco_0177692, partial [Tanacetum coccineum]
NTPQTLIPLRPNLGVLQSGIAQNPSLAWGVVLLWSQWVASWTWAFSSFEAVYLKPQGHVTKGIRDKSKVGDILLPRLVYEPGYEITVNDLSYVYLCPCEETIGKELLD